MAEARGEVVYGASFLEWYAEEGRRVYGETIPSSDPTKRYIGKDEKNETEYYWKEKREVEVKRERRFIFLFLFLFFFVFQSLSSRLEFVLPLLPGISPLP